MRFRGLDLNLLVALDVLLTERNVSRAGGKLNLSQSATSNALSRLREYFSDDLLVQSGREMILTARAAELAGPVRKALLQVEAQIITKPGFDPSTSTKTFTLMASDYVSLVALRYGLAAINKQAPNLKFEVLPVSNNPSQRVDRGDVDLLILPDHFVSTDHPTELLFIDDYKCVIDVNHPSIGKTISFEDFLSLPHVMVKFSTGRKSTFEDIFIERYGNSRNIDLVVGTYAEVPFYVTGTDRIATLHARHAELVANQLGLRVLDLPIEVPPIKEVMQWNMANEKDEASIWLRQKLIAHVSDHYSTR